MLQIAETVERERERAGDKYWQESPDNALRLLAPEADTNWLFDFFFHIHSHSWYWHQRRWWQLRQHPVGGGGVREFEWPIVRKKKKKGWSKYCLSNLDATVRHTNISSFVSIKYLWGHIWKLFTIKFGRETKFSGLKYILNECIYIRQNLDKLFILRLLASSSIIPLDVLWVREKHKVVPLWPMFYYHRRIHLISSYTHTHTHISISDRYNLEILWRGLEALQIVFLSPLFLTHSRKPLFNLSD
jgi:hypothetical protein